jgi:hypothetical protein
MPLYDLEARHHALPHQEPFPDQRTLDRLWSLFVAIGRHWQNDTQPERMRSNWLVFIANRIRVDPRYAGEYTNAAAVLDELIAELGEPAAYDKLFTDPAANTAPPTTRLARARQKVSNEFIALQLALGGFKAWGALNYLGYIAGANVPGQPPYRTGPGKAP